MDIRKIKKLIELVEESGIAELEITEGEESVRINRHSSAPVMHNLNNTWQLQRHLHQQHQRRLLQQ